MKKNFLRMLALISVTLIGVHFTILPVLAETDQSIEQINSLRTSLVQAFEARDIEGMLKNTHPDIMVTWQNGEVSHGQVEVRKFIDRMLTGPTSIVEKVTGNPVVEGRKHFGDQIISYGHMNDEFVLRGESSPLRFDSRFSALLIKDKERYVLAGLHLSANAFENPVVAAMFSRLSKLGFLVFIAGCALGVVITVVLQKKRATTT